MYAPHACYTTGMHITPAVIMMVTLMVVGGVAYWASSGINLCVDVTPGYRAGRARGAAGAVMMR